MPLDLVLPLLLAASVMMTGAMALAWLQLGRERHLLVWTAAYGTSTLQWLSNAGGISWKSPSLMALSGVAMIASISFTLVAIRIRAAHRRPWRPVVSAALAMTAVAALLSMLGNVHLMLSAIVPAYVCGCCMAAALALRPEGRSHRLGELSFSVVFWLFALFEVVVIVSGTAAATLRTPAALSTYYQVIGWGVPVLYVASGLAAILLVTEDRVEVLAGMVATDPLTGVANRRGLEIAGGKCLARSRRSNLPLSVLACDLDDFKSINDNFGHAVGDEALRLFSTILVREVREGDVVGRVGGDEFLVVLADADAQQGALTMERIRTALLSVHVMGAHGALLQASFGIAQANLADDLPSLIERADLALYEAKRASKSRPAARGGPPRRMAVSARSAAGDRG